MRMRDEDDEDDDEAVDFDELQPARTTQASRGMAMSARKRRMKTSIVVDVSAVSLLALPGAWAPQRPVRSKLPGSRR